MTANSKGTPTSIITTTITIIPANTRRNQTPLMRLFNRAPTCAMGMAVAARQAAAIWISRCHARITVDGHSAVLEDLGSRNGTFLNGREGRGRRDVDRRERAAELEVDVVDEVVGRVVVRRPAGAARPSG